MTHPKQIIKKPEYFHIGLLVLLLASSSAAQQHKDDTWEQNYTIQALLGGVKYDDLVFQSTDSTDTSTIDISTIPQLGGAWATRPKGDKFQFGLETTFLLGFRLDEVNYAYLGGNGAQVNISTSLWMIDFSGGGYVNVPLGSKLRLYGAAGPLLMIADYRSDREYTDSTPNNSQSDTVFGLGLYARTGLELQVHRHGHLGAGLRMNWSNADFSEVGGESELSGVAAFITYTAGL